MIPLLVGTALAVIVLAFVLWPLLRDHDETPARVAPPDASAVADDEVEAALAAYRREVAICPRCGPRPERDAAYCSNCGRALTARAEGAPE